MNLFSVVVPCYNEENSILLFYDEFIQVFRSNSNVFGDMGYEIILINDGSSDNTLNSIKSLSDRDDNVKYISFSRNFGKEAALYAGLEMCNGDYVAVMDVDLQDPPSLLPEMFRELDSGCDVVATRRVSRKGEPVKRVIMDFRKILQIC